MSSKPGISQLLIDAALDADLRRRLLDSPEEAFQAFELSAEEQEVLRHPDHRLLAYLGAALTQKTESCAAVPQPPAPHAVVQASLLPDVSMVLTVVPCAQYVNDQLDSISYAVWVNPLPAGVDPASLPPPQGASIPGKPLTPLHAVIQLTAVQMQDAAGNPQVGLAAAFRQSTNMTAPPPPGSGDALAVQAAAAAVRSAEAGERYGKLLDLIHALRGEAAR
ncbi:MAG TPA: hypothetical protein VG456_12175 [Candidatus Sulfopaludibacter sp.]|jgi:hypothetical protein|nr:hypothetical protein [Candidatus Sulfopaludibacter sp.]